MAAMGNLDASVGADQAKPNTDYKEEPAFKKLAKGEQWRRMAANGDVRGLLPEMGRAIPGLFNFKDFGEYLRQALDVLAQTNPTGFAEFLHTDILTAAGKMVIHSRFLLEQQLRKQCENRQGSGEWLAQPEFDVLSAKVMTLQLHVAKLLQMDSNRQRILEQTRKLRLANDKAAAKKNRRRQPARGNRLSTPRQPITTSRISGEIG